MRQAIVAAAIAVTVLHAEARADQYNAFQGVSFGFSDIDPSTETIFVPAFDRTRGTLQSVTFALSGVATETISYYQNAAPASGTFVNTVQFNNDAPITLSTMPFDARSFTSANTFGETFGVVSQATYPASYFPPGDSSLALTLSVDGAPQPPSCCAYGSVRFLGSLATVYTYTPVPEPVSLAVLAGPVIAVGAMRRARPSR